MGAYSTVDCQELHATWEEFADDSVTTAKVDLLCAYNDRWDLAADIVANRRAWPKAPIAAAIIPRARSAAIKPFGEAEESHSGQEIIYNQAIVTIQYTSAGPEQDEEENLYAEELTFSAQAITLPHNLFRWGSATGEPLQENEAPGKALYSMNLNRTLYKVPPPIPASIGTLVGTVNDTTYVSPSLGISFAAETLLFQPSGISRTITTEFDGAFDISLSFAWQPQGWNKFWRASTGTWTAIYTAAGEYKNYPTADMSDWLF